MNSLLREVAVMIRDSGRTDEDAVATARAVLRHVGAAARVEGGTWTGQWMERQASAPAAMESANG
jgi:hypothetical protein